MNSGQWQKIEELFHAAAELAPDARAAWLAEACAGDAGLRQRVEDLLAAHDEAGDFIEASPRDSLLATPAPAASRSGHTIGHYEVGALLGAGGMGEVYLARDLKLERQVALKILPAQFTADAAQIERFAREARAASALNHPNILTIHEIGHDAGTHFIATEFVAGETLRAVIKRGKVAPPEAARIAGQIAAALAAAHAAGIVHRDIKPENVMLRPDGLVKVLDFGLAKPLGIRNSAGGIPNEEGLSSDLPNSNIPNSEFRIPNSQTDPVWLIGTLAYLSPERAQREEVDQRTDLFSLGVVLYEMITGTRPFEGATGPAVLAAIRTREPLLKPELPLAWRRLLQRALAKDRAARYQTAVELRDDLKKLARPGPDWRRRGWLAAAALGVVLLLAGVIYRFNPAQRTHANASPWLAAAVTQLTRQPGEELFPSLAPDGQSFVYASQSDGNWDIYWQATGQPSARNLTADCAENDTYPAFSPNGQWIAFRSERGGGGIFLMKANGGAVRQLTKFGYHPAWSPNGQELLCTDENAPLPSDRAIAPRKLWVIDAATGQSRLLSSEDIAQPQWSPTGARIAYWGQRANAQRDIMTMPVRGGAPTSVTNDEATDWNPVWSPDGRHLYFTSDRAGPPQLWRVALDESSGQVLGPVEPVLGPAQAAVAFGQQMPSLARTGRHLLYVATQRPKKSLHRLAFDPALGVVTGAPAQLTPDALRLTEPSLSPDGQWLACRSTGEPREDLFVLRSDGSDTPRNLTNGRAKNREPRWSPNGKQLAFYSNQSGSWEVWVINADGSGQRQLTYSAPENAFKPLWSPDGTRLLYITGRGQPHLIEVARPWWEQTPQPLGALSAGQTFWTHDWSADGLLLTGLWQAREAGTPRQISAYSFQTRRFSLLVDGPGTHPAWLNDNRRVLFIRAGKLWLAEPAPRLARQVFSALPRRITNVVLTRDNCLLYFNAEENEADVYLLTLR